MLFATNLGVDNDGVLKLTKKTVHHTQAKHYRIAQAYIRQLVQDGFLSAYRLHTDDNWTDMFTNALHASPFVRHRDKIMGPQDLEF